MRSHRQVYRFLGLSGLAVMLVPLAGCSKIFANFSLNQARDRVGEAEAFHVEENFPEELSRVNTTINATQQNLDTGQSAAARTSGKEAATLAKDLLERAKTRRAEDMRTQSNEWIGIMDHNDGRFEDPIKYAEIRDIQAEGDEAYGKQDWEDSIEAHETVAKEIEFLLVKLKQESEQGIDDTEEDLTKLEEEGAAEHNPEAITEINGYIETLQDLVLNKHHYRDAIRTREEAHQRVLEGITDTKRIKSDKQIRRIERLLDEAERFGAQMYAEQSLKDAGFELEQLLTQHLTENFDTALTTAPRLILQAEDLIVETKRNLARVNLDSVAVAIEDLTEGQARRHLPGRVERLEELLQEAQGLFDAGNYTRSADGTDGATEVCTRALEEKNEIESQFNARAQEEIRTASGAVAVAEGLLGRMEEIIGQSAGGTSPRTEVWKVELRARVVNAGIQLASAEVNREVDRVFHESIETARGVAAEAAQISNEVGHAVADHAVADLGRLLTIYESQGGRQHAARELDSAEKMLLGVRELIGQGNYRDANRGATGVYAQIDILAQELERVALDKQESARDAIETARRSRATGEALDQVLILLNQSRSNLEGGGVKDAIEAADRAAQLAGEAADQGLRSWIGAELRHTDVMLERGREAGAETYSPILTDEAKNLKRNAEELLRAGNLSEALSSAAEASATAESALTAPIDRADEAISRAKLSGTFIYEPNRLSDAMVNAGYARDHMDQGNFTTAIAFARQAETTARNARMDAETASIKDRVDALKAAVEAAEQGGPGFYQIVELSDILAEVQRTGVESRTEDYQDTISKLELLDAQLALLAETTPDVLSDLVRDMNGRLSALEQRGAGLDAPGLVEGASDKVNYAQIDFQRERYRSSYQNAREALVLMDRIELRLDERDYDQALGDSFQQFSDTVHGFAEVLDMGAEILLRLLRGPEGKLQAGAVLMSVTNPADLREQIDKLAAKASTLQPPSTRELVQRQTTKMYDLAQSAAAGFEKLLILDQFTREEGRRMILTAYLQMDEAKKRQQEIQQLIETPRLGSRAAGQGIIRVR